jgi:hypothetical protein
MRAAPITTDRRPRLVPLVVLAAALLLAACAPARAQELVRMSAGFGDGARLGETTSIGVKVAVVARMPLVTEVRLLTPSGIDLSSSELGMATCAQPKSVLEEVMNSVRHRLCPGNALLANGRAKAELRFGPSPEEIYDGAARLALYAGQPVGDKPGLLVVADAYRPIRTQLFYSGYLYIPPPQYGVGLAIDVKPIPQPPFRAPLALASFGFTIGAPSLTYVKTEDGRRVPYHPRGIPLPRKCPAGGFRFRVVMRLQDDARRPTADARVPCPRAGAAVAQQ